METIETGERRKPGRPRKYAQGRHQAAAHSRQRATAISLPQQKRARARSVKRSSTGSRNPFPRIGFWRSLAARRSSKENS